jgi:hypothetical protein
VDDSVIDNEIGNLTLNGYKPFANKIKIRVMEKIQKSRGIKC